MKELILTIIFFLAILCLYMETIKLATKDNIIEILETTLENKCMLQKETSMNDKLDQSSKLQVYIKLSEVVNILQDIYEEAEENNEIFDDTPLNLTEDALDHIYYELSDEEINYLDKLEKDI